MYYTLKTKLLLLKQKKSIKHVSIYTLTGSLTKIISFAALPLFVNYLSEADIGTLNIFSNTIVFLTPISSLGVLYTISVDYFKKPKEEFPQILSSSLIIPFVSIILLTPILFVFRDLLHKTFNFQPEFLWMIPVCLFLNFCFEAFIIVLRNEERVKTFSSVLLTRTVIEISLALFFIVFIYTTWYGRALGYLTSSVVIAILFFFHLYKKGYLTKKIKLSLIRKEVAFGLAGLLLQASIFFLNTSDKFFVMAQFGPTQTGFYAIASTFATVLFILSGSMMLYLKPKLYPRFANNERWHGMKTLYKKYIVLLSLAAVGVYVFSKLTYIFLLKHSYSAYFYLVTPILISCLIWTISNLFLQYLIFQKDKKKLGLIALVAIVIAVTMNLVTTRTLGLNFVGYGLIVTNMLVLMIILLFNYRQGFFRLEKTSLG